MGNWDFTDPFREARDQEGVLVNDFAGERIPMLLRFRDVRRAARDYRTFSSDAPFRVPVPDEKPFRIVRELPIETDPPRHTAYRAIVQPWFERPRQPELMQAVDALVEELLDGIPLGATVDAIRELAFPLQSRALALLLKRPVEEGKMWSNWGVSVLHDDATRARFYAYLDDALGAARDNPGDDFFGALVTADHQGGRLSDEEIQGYAILTFAGGRDTVIASIALVLAHFADHPEDLERLRSEPGLINRAVEEFVRIGAPLTHIGRVCPAGADALGVAIPRDHRASLCWAAANRDPGIFEAPDELRIDRMANPHVGFGVGAHTCLGAHQARLILRTLVHKLCARVGKIIFVSGQRRYEEWPGYRRQIGYDSLHVQLTATDS